MDITLKRKSTSIIEPSGTITLKRKSASMVEPFEGITLKRKSTAIISQKPKFTGKPSLADKTGLLLRSLTFPEEVLGKGFVRFGASMPQFMGGLIKEAGERFGEAPDVFDWLSPPAGIGQGISKLISSKLAPKTEWDEKIAGFGAKMIESNKEYIKKNFPQYETPLLRLLEDVGAGAGSLAASIGLGILTKNTAAPAALFGLIQKGQVYEEARQAGKTPRFSGRASSVAGTGEALLEKIGLDFIFKRFGGRIVNILGKAATEAVQEMSQQASEETITAATGIRKYEGIAPILKRVGYAGLIGAITGGPAAVILDVKQDTVDRLMKAGVDPASATVLANKMAEEGKRAGAEIAGEVAKTPEIGAEVAPEQRLEGVGEPSMAKPEITLKRRVLPVSEEKAPIPAIEPVEAKPESLIKQAKEFKTAEEFVRKMQGKGYTAKKLTDAWNKAQGVVTLTEAEKRAAEKGITKEELLKQKIDMIERGIKTGKVLTKKEIKTIQGDLVDIIQKSDLELKDKGKFLATVKNIQTNDQLIKALPGIQDRISKLELSQETRVMLRKIKKFKVIKGMHHEERMAITDLKSKLKGERDLATLNKAYDEIQKLKEQGKKKYIETKESRDAKFALDKEILIKTQKTPEGKIKAPIIKSTRKKRFIGKTLRVKSLRPHRVLDTFDHGQDFKGPHSKFFWSRANTAVNEEIRQEDSRKEKMFTWMESQKITINDLGKTRKIEGKDYTVDEMITVYVAKRAADAGDPTKMLALVYGNNLTESGINKIIEQMSDKEKALGDKIIEDYEDNKTRLRIAYINYMDGAQDLGERIFYTPIRRTQKGYLPTETEMANEMLSREGLRRAYTERGFTKPRIENIPAEFQAPISMGEFGIWLGQISKQEHFISHGNLVKEMQRMVRDKEFRASIENNPKFGEAYYDTLQKYVDRIANNNIYKTYDMIEKAPRILRKHAAVVNLAYNIVTMAKQFPSIALFLREVSPLQLMGGVTDLTFDYKNKIKFIHDRSPQMKRRMIEREMEEFKEQSYNAYQKIISKVGRAGFKGIYAIDRFVTHAGWLATYNKYTSPKFKLSEQEAIEEAEKAVLTTQPAAHAKDIAEIYASNEFLNMFLQFSNQLNQIYNMITYDIPMKARVGKPLDAIQGTMGVLLSAFMIWVMSKGRLPEDKEDFKDMMAGTFLSYIPIFGSMLNSWRQGFEMVSIPALGGLEEALNKKWFKSAAYILGIPWVQFERTLKGVIALSSGEASDYRRLIWSGWALGEGKKKPKFKGFGESKFKSKFKSKFPSTF